MPHKIPDRLLKLFGLCQAGTPDWRGLAYGIWVFSLLLISTTWLVTWQLMASEQALQLQYARHHQQNLTAIIGENLSQVLDRGRILAIAAASGFDGLAGETGKQVGAMRSVDKAIIRIAIYDNALQQRYSSSPARPSGKLTEAIRSAITQPAVDSSPRLGPIPDSDEEAWQFPLFFPLQGKDGSRLGIMHLVVDLGYFLQLYRPIELGRSGNIKILKADGENIAEATQAGLILSPRKSGFSGESLARSGECQQWAVPNAIGKAYFGCFRHLDNYPLIVAVTRSVDDIQADLTTSQFRIKLTLSITTLFILLFTFWITRSIARQRALFEALKISNDEKYLLIFQLEEEKQRAIELAAHDHLTGLHNRRMFNELAASHIARARRSRKHYALLYIDLDRFKKINDTLGHHVGDLLLQGVAERLRTTLRKSDLIARLGGDEFACLLIGLESIDDTSAVAAKLIDEISRPYANLDGHEIQVSPSIGVALFPRDGQDEETLCRHADIAMYRAKHSGRGKYVFYDPMLNPSGEHRFNIEQRLPAAISGGEMVLHYQPKVSLADYRIVGLEALVRWNHPEFGLVYPGEFIALAEETGLINALGDWVAEACCRQLAEWTREALPVVPIAFNVSPIQLQDDQFATRIAGYAERHGVPTHLLDIEITENLLVDSLASAETLLHEISALGISIALDDFGTGFSSLSHVRQLPIDCIKIDRSFINNIRESQDDAVIVDSMITLAHNLGIRVIAEGVEMLEQIRHLKTAGCDEAQGYCLSRPVNAESTRDLLLRSTLVPA